MRPRKVCRVAYAGSDVAGQDACQERGGSVPERAGRMPERAGPVKLQTKGMTAPCSALTGTAARES